MAAPDHQHELLLQAARSAVEEFQARRRRRRPAARPTAPHAPPPTRTASAASPHQQTQPCTRFPSQAGRAAPSVEDILHLEKRFARLPGASGGAVALDDASQLLAAEVLAGEPLELVAAAVLGGGAGAGVLTKRQFLSLAHVAEVAQRAAFDLVTAEDALRSQVRRWGHLGSWAKFARRP